MNAELLKDRYITVCDAPRGNGFRVEHMPDFLLHSEINDCSPHVHSFYEILWFQEGEGTHNVDFVDYEVKPNTIFFLAPGQTHNCVHSWNDFSDGSFLAPNTFDHTMLLKAFADTKD